MKVSILVPVYNVSKYIEKCTESLFEQTYSDIEYVFVNDCSPDDSIGKLMKCIDNHPERQDDVKIIHHKYNKGLAASRLTGLDNANGDCIMFVDSDDFLDTDAVEVLVKKMEEDGCDIVSAGITHLFDNNTKSIDLPAQCSDKIECLKLMLERRVSMNGVARLYRRDLFGKISNPFVDGINFGEDYLMTSRVFYCAKKISYVNRSVYYYIHTKSDSYTFHFKRINLDNLKKVDDMITLFYQNIGNKELLECHYVGRLKLKSEQLITFLRSTNQEKGDYQYIKESFEDNLKKIHIRRLPFQDQLILILSDFLPLWVMNIYVRVGYKAKQVLKQMC